MPEERLTDIDSELREMMAVEPSVEFAARVRQRAGAERMADASWRPAWAWAAAAGVTVVVVGVIALRPVTGVSVPPPPPVVAVALPPVSPRSGVQYLPRVGNAGVGAGRQAAPRPIRKVGASAEPEVLIDVRQTAGMKRLSEMLRDGNAMNPTEGAGVVDLPIAIEPLLIPALSIESAVAIMPPGRFNPYDFQSSKE